MAPADSVAEEYLAFAAYADADSPTFADWSRGVAADPEVRGWISTLPEPKRQPNLVFAAARWHGVQAPGPYAGLRDALLADDGRIRRTILSRATQTNEAGRLATLLPAFASIAGDKPFGSSRPSAPQGKPLALIEVGASAGLCLYPDRWGYEWVTPDGPVTLGPEPRLRCQVTGSAPLPDRLPTVGWRCGVDLHPLDVADDDAMAWLAMLVWPEHDDRRAILEHAVDIARADPPRLVRGDLLRDLPGLVEEAAAYGEVVVFHSAVIAYLDDLDRRRFAATMADLVAAGACHWVSNEGRRVLPEVTRTGPVMPETGTFVLGVDGQAVAWTHGHGRSLTWLGSTSQQVS